MDHGKTLLSTVLPVRGRGSSVAMQNRFARDSREAFDDGWPGFDVAGEPETALQTRVSRELARSALTRNESPDIYFRYGLNPYRGCEHGCSYCYARPTHSYLGLSPGLDFETQIVAKTNIADLLRAELQRPAYQVEQIALGTVTDCYQPVERELRLTRSVLEVLSESSHPFGVVTKGSGVERDLDLIAPMAAKGLAAVYLTITTLDPGLARKMEPRAAAPYRRLRTIQTLSEHGIPVGVSVGPQIPFLNDDLEQVLEAAWVAGARSAFYTVLRLPWELSPLFRQWIEMHYPDRARRIMARVQDLHGVSDSDRARGKDYSADFATRMKGAGVWAALIKQRFEKTCARLGFNRVRFELDTSQFLPPEAAGQARLF